MRINNNLIAMNSHRMLGMNNNSTSKSVEKLSSGLRINKAGDDAAGLVISEKMRSQIRGLKQSSRNAQDAISMIQTAEGALGEVHDILQRMRELSVQSATDTNNQSDRNALQAEVSELKSEINRISSSTEFNDQKLLDGTIGSETIGTSEMGSSTSEPLNETEVLKQRIIDGLKSGWLEEGANLVNAAYGIVPDAGTPQDVAVIFDQGSPGDDLASIQTSWSISGGNDATINSMELHIDLTDFDPSTGDSGENSMTQAGSKMYNDRIIAHEMVHAIMGNALGDDYYDMPTWFKEGTAEFVHGADERLKVDIAAATNGVDDILQRASDLIGGAAWNGDSLDYSASYLAVKFIESNTGGNDFTDIVSGIDDDVVTTDNTNASIVSNTSFASIAALQTALTDGTGSTYYGTLDIQGLGVDEIDTGSFKGSNHGGSAFTAEDIVPNGTISGNPTNFNFIFPEIETASSTASSTSGSYSLIGGEEIEISEIDPIELYDDSETKNNSFGLVYYDDSTGNEYVLNFNIDEGKYNDPVEFIQEFNKQLNLEGQRISNISGDDITDEINGLTLDFEVITESGANYGKMYYTLDYEANSAEVNDTFTLSDANLSQDIRNKVLGAAGDVTLTVSNAAANIRQSMNNYVSDSSGNYIQWDDYSIDFEDGLSAEARQNNTLKMTVDGLEINAGISEGDYVTSGALSSEIKEAILGVNDGNSGNYSIWTSSKAGTNFRTLADNTDSTDGLINAVDQLTEDELEQKGFNGSLDNMKSAYFDQLTSGLSVEINDANKIEISSPTRVSLDLIDNISNKTATKLGLINPTSSSELEGASIQVGANRGQNLSLSISRIDTSSLGALAISSDSYTLDDVDIRSKEDAQKSIEIIDEAISNVSDERSKLGSYQNRLEHTIKNLDVSSENLQYSESRIRDVDMASEMMSFTKNNILQQAAQSMLSQANQQPQAILSLLR